MRKYFSNLNHGEFSHYYLGLNLFYRKKGRVFTKWGRDARKVDSVRSSPKTSLKYFG